jgi:hypothetical protein
MLRIRRTAAVAAEPQATSRLQRIDDHRDGVGQTKV